MLEETLHQHKSAALDLTSTEHRHLLPTRRTTERDNDSMDSVWQSALLVLQAFQLAFLLVHDWIPLGPFNDVRAVRRENAVRLVVIGTTVSSAPVVAALWLSIRYFGQPYPTWVRVWLWLTYGLLFAGELEAWWIPYLFRSDAKRRARYQAMFGHTHAFLPERNGIVPNTLHVVLHAATLATLLVLTQLNG